MLIGQQLGPFLIEKELGAGAMGAVFRGKYVKTGQLVAVKIMAPGLGTSSPSATARFDREAAILKQLHHPNIVRLFGVGKFKGTPYYAMEFVKGESLDHVMARRGRMSWEEVVDLGTQLCGALQHAHEAGIVHRDLKPSNLMILEDGTLKLTDFGIAKDLDVTQLTGANCTIGTAAYMSPEQCKGVPDLTLKSDLYSLGVVFYELITGRKPFVTDNAMEMFLMHVNGKFERPSRIVLDLPSWMDTLICQMLEKKPEHRPRDAAMVGEVLATIQEKVEAQQSAGVEAAKAHYMDLPRDRRNVSDEERDVTRSLLGKKPRKNKKAKEKQKRFVVLLQALGLLVLLAGVVGGIVWLAQPPSAASLYGKAERLMKSDNADRHDQARDGPIKRYLELYGNVEDDKTRQVRLWADDYDAARFEKLLDRHVRRHVTGRGLDVEAQSAAQEAAFKAAIKELDGNRTAAIELWQEAIRQDDGSGVAVVGRRHLAALARIDEEDRRFDELRRQVRDDRVEPELDEWRKRAFLALRQERLGDRLGAQRSYQKLHEAIAKEAGLHTDPNLRAWQLYGRVKAQQMTESLADKAQDEAGRARAIQKVVEEARAALGQGNVKLLDVRAVAHDVVTLYGKDADLASAVEEARAVVKTIDTKVPRR